MPDRGTAASARPAGPPPDTGLQCLYCGFPVVSRPWGCRNPCGNCGCIYPLGDCSD